VELFVQQVLAGLATGGIYACMALAVVMIYQAIDHLNFAQGEMAMFSTFIAWQLLHWGLPYWAAFVLTIGISFVAGVVIERIVFKPIQNAPVLSHVVVFIALFAISTASRASSGASASRNSRRRSAPRLCSARASSARTRPA
jgi:branched-chain amino acid transport system permease protein